MRVILDTNVWSEIGRRDSRELIEALAIDRGWQIQTPPSVLLEILQTPDPEVMQKIIRALSSPHWMRLRTEAEYEAGELIAEVRRLRPGWVRQVPNPGPASRHRTFWTKNIWRLARQDPGVIAQKSTEVHARDAAIAFSVQKNNRDARLVSGMDLSDLRNVVMYPEQWTDDPYLAGWEVDQRIEGWRVSARDVFWNALRTAPLERLRGRDSTYTDWIEGYLRVDLMTSDKADFTRLWFNEVDEVKMPRVWLRWAVETAMLMTRVTESSPADAQLSAYLPDCELFVSSDRRFVQSLEVVRRSSLFELPQIVRLPSLKVNESAVAALDSAVYG